MAFEDPEFKPIDACEDDKTSLIDNSYRDAWMLYQNSSFEQLSDDDVEAIVFELQSKSSELYSQGEQEFMDSFTESTKSRDTELPSAEKAWEKYLMQGVKSLNGIEVAEINAMLQQSGESNFVTDQYRTELQERREQEKSEDANDIYKKAA